MGIEALGTGEVQRHVLDSLSRILQEPGSSPAWDWSTFLGSWAGFSDWRLLLRLAISVSVAITLTAAIALHPGIHGRATTAEAVRYPTTLFLYTIVGAMVAEVVVVNPSMALVVFGIGGLLRFRTKVGEAVETGQLILVTIIGISCGLRLFPLAVLGTLVGWLLLYIRHREVLYTVELSGLQGDVRTLDGSLRETLNAMPARVVHARPRGDKGRIEYLLWLPSNVTVLEMEDTLRGALNEDAEVEVYPS